MIETLEAIKEAAEKLSGMDFENIREAFNRRELHNWELDRDAARKRYASVKRKNKKLPRGQKLKPEKMPKRPRKITTFGMTGGLYALVAVNAGLALEWARRGMPGRVLDHAAGVLCCARRVRRIADKAEPLLDCGYRLPVEVRRIADLIESLEEKAKEFIKQGGK